MAHYEPDGRMTTEHKQYVSKVILPYVLDTVKMPFGKYKDWLLIDLPEPYVMWFSREGFPKGKLGEMLRVIYEIKLNGLEYLFDGILKR